MKLTGRTILVTGGSAGIGLAFARKLLALGNEVIVTGRRQAALDDLKAHHPKLHVMCSDVADPAQVAALAYSVKAQFPRLDMLINNAGVMLYRNLQTPTEDLAGLLTEMNINFGGVVRTTAAFIDILVANRGAIINVSSALAFVPSPSVPIYSATKAAIHSYTQSLRFQLEEAGVEVIEILPPVVDTDMTAEMSHGVNKMSPDELVNVSLKAMHTGATQIAPGQAKQLAFMRRLAPGFIGKMLWKATRKQVPTA